MNVTALLLSHFKEVNETCSLEKKKTHIRRWTDIGLQLWVKCLIKTIIIYFVTMRNECDRFTIVTLQGSEWDMFTWSGGTHHKWFLSVTCPGWQRSAWLARAVPWAASPCLCRWACRWRRAGRCSVRLQQVMIADREAMRHTHSYNYDTTWCHLVTTI